jgi:hypothetical protein
MNINGKLFLWVLDIIRAGDVVERIEKVLRPGERAGGRPRQFGLDVWLAAFVVATITGSGAFEVRAHRVLTQDLPRSLQVRLGLRRRAVGSDAVTRPISVAQVRGPLDQLAARLNQDEKGLSDLEREDRRETLRGLVCAMAAATIPMRHRLSGSWAVDNTAVESWGKPWTRPKDAAGAISHESEARWGHRTPTFQTGDRDRVFGYKKSSYTLIAPLPAYIEAMEVRPAHEHGEEPAMRLAELLHRKLTNAGRKFGLVIADREYSHAKPERWHHPMRAMGAELVMDIHQLDRGVEHYRGAMFLDGGAFCPGMPGHLLPLERPARSTLGPRPGPDEPLKERSAWDALKKALAWARRITSLREPYALVRIAGNGAGKERFACPALHGKVVCPLRAFTMQLPDSDLLPEVTPPRPALQVADGICFRQSITVYEDVSPKTRQRLQWQSEKWALLYNKRPSVERGYASMKSGATEDVGRGWIQLRGIVKVSFMLAVAVMSQNLRLALGEIAVNGPDEGPEADVILRGPEEFFGHEELNVYGDIDRYDTPHNSDH